MADNEASYRRDRDRDRDQDRDRREPPAAPALAAGITIPIGWFVAIAASMVSLVGGGAWYMADQAAEIRGLRGNISRLEGENTAQRKTFDEALGAVRIAVNAIDTRATRMESQLIYITDQLRSGKK